MDHKRILQIITKEIDLTTLTNEELNAIDDDCIDLTNLVRVEIQKRTQKFINLVLKEHHSHKGINLPEKILVSLVPHAREILPLKDLMMNAILADCKKGDVSAIRLFAFFGALFNIEKNNREEGH